MIRTSFFSVRSGLFDFICWDHLLCFLLLGPCSDLLETLRGRSRRMLLASSLGRSFRRPTAPVRTLAPRLGLVLIPFKVWLPLSPSWSISPWLRFLRLPLWSLTLSSLLFSWGMFLSPFLRVLAWALLWRLKLWFLAANCVILGWWDYSFYIYFHFHSCCLQLPSDFADLLSILLFNACV